MHQACLEEAVQALRDKADHHLTEADRWDRRNDPRARGFARQNRVRAAAYGWAAGQLRTAFQGRP